MHLDLTGGNAFLDLLHDRIDVALHLVDDRVLVLGNESAWDAVHLGIAQGVSLSGKHARNSEKLGYVDVVVPLVELVVPAFQRVGEDDLDEFVGHVLVLFLYRRDYTDSPSTIGNESTERTPTV